MAYIYFVQLDIPDALDAELNRIYDPGACPDAVPKVPGVRRVSRYLRGQQSNDSSDAEISRDLRNETYPMWSTARRGRKRAPGAIGRAKIRPHTTSRYHSFFREILKAGKGRDAGAPYIYVVQMDIPAATRGRVQPRLRHRARAALVRVLQRRHTLPARKIERQPHAEIHGDLRDRLAFGPRKQAMAGGRRTRGLGNQNPPPNNQPAPFGIQENLRADHLCPLLQLASRGGRGPTQQSREPSRAGPTCLGLS